MGEPGPADVELGGDTDGAAGAEALLVVDVVEALALAVVGPELERDQPEVVELVLVAQAGPHIVGQKAGGAEQIVGGAGEQPLAGAALDRWQVGGRGQLVAAVRPLLLPGPEVQRPLAGLRAEAHVDIGVPEPETAAAGGAADRRSAGTSGNYPTQIAAALERRLDVHGDILGDLAPGLDTGPADERIGLRTDHCGVVLVLEVIELRLETPGEPDVGVGRLGAR